MYNVNKKILVVYAILGLGKPRGLCVLLDYRKMYTYVQIKSICLS